MATHNHSVSKAGKKRKHDEPSVLNTSPTKKVKASGLEFSEQIPRSTLHSKSHTGVVENVTVSNPAEDGWVVRKENRKRPKVKTDRTTEPTISKATTKAERHLLKKREKREKRKANKTLIRGSKNTVRHQDQVKVNEAEELVQHRQKWSSSLPSGGCFLPHDPIFVQDTESKQFLLCATRREVQLLSLADSLVTRSYLAPTGLYISCFALDAANDNLVHVVLNNGRTAIWNWQSDSATQKKSIDANVHGIASGLWKHGDTSLFSVSNVGTKFGVLRQGEIVFSTDRSLQSIQVIGNGEYVVCQGQSELILGARTGDSADEFIWIEVPLTSLTTCIDARITPPRRSGGKSARHRSGLSVAVGFNDGRINLYSDMSAAFEQGPTSPEIAPPRTLHWHREAVSAIKFSPDGHYLVSGGTETVLVLWQLETGKKQYSPHLKAAIDRIAVNSEGNRYALQMGDHSIMVLNSSDFKAVAYYAKLQATCPMEYSKGPSLLPRMSAALHPSDASQLLVAVPATQPKGERHSVARPFLQAFDTFRSSHIRLQALQRNFTTEVNVAPDGNSLVPPDVTHIAISYDGAWLATVDEWEPAISDLEYLAADVKGLGEEQQKRREVYLRVWAWDQRQEAWLEGYTRERPHSRVSGELLGAGRVLGLVADPASRGFATVGEDGCVKIWTWSKDKQNDSLTWKCRHSTPLPYARSSIAMLDGSAPLENSAWHLAYSTDGSLLAVGYSKPLMANSGAPNEMYFIDTSNGTIHSSKSGRTGGDIKGLAFLGRYYVALSAKAVYVWDFVDDRLMYKAKTSSRHADLTSRSNIRFASNGNGMTFAVVVDNKVVVFDPRQTKRLYKQEFERNVQSILTSPSSLGYTLIFDDNTILTISPFWSTPNNDRPAIDKMTALPLDGTASAEEEVSDERSAVDLVATLANEELSRHGNVGDEDDRPVVTSERLAEICDPKADGTLPTVYDMFWGVVRLCARKPLIKA